MSDYDSEEGQPERTKSRKEVPPRDESPLTVSEHAEVPQQQAPIIVSQAAMEVAPSIAPSLFKESEWQWPMLDDPSKRFGETLSNKPLEFVEPLPTDGRWCVGQSHKFRIVRQCYRVVWKRVHAAVGAKEHFSLILTGHPGIGKSNLLDMLLSWSLCAHSEMPVLVIAVQKMHLFVDDGKKKKRYEVERNDFNKVTSKTLLGVGIAKGSTILVLHDIKSEQSLPYQTGLLSSLREVFTVVCVAATSPRRENTKDLRKEDDDVAVLRLPTLSVDEAGAFVKKNQESKRLTFDEATFSDWFYKVGGVPRHLSSQEKVDIAVSEQKDVVTTVRYDPSQSASVENTNMIVMGLATPDLKPNGFDFVSNHAAMLWTRERVTDVNAILEKLRKGLISDRDVYGRIFEKWVLMKITAALDHSKQIAMCYITLPKDGSKAKLKRWELPSERAVEVHFNGTKWDLAPNEQPTIYIPKLPNFPFVDAIVIWKKGSGLFASLLQVTVASEHAPSKAQVEELLAALTKRGVLEYEVVWIVDQKSTLNKWQPLKNVGTSPTSDSDNWGNIPQYLCRLDEAAWMCWVCADTVPQDERAAASVCFPVPDPASATGKDILQLIQQLVEDKATVVLNQHPEAPVNRIGTQGQPLLFACM